MKGADAGRHLFLLPAVTPKQRAVRRKRGTLRICVPRFRVFGRSVVCLNGRQDFVPNLYRNINDDKVEYNDINELINSRLWAEASCRFRKYARNASSTKGLRGKVRCKRCK